MSEAENGAQATEEQLRQALDSSTKYMRRLLRHVDEAGLDERAARELKRSKRQLRENRQLLGIGPKPDTSE